jgi:hypothetical protein
MEHLITSLAKGYFARLEQCRRRLHDPKAAGTAAQCEWVQDLRNLGAREVVTEPRTGVTNGNTGGQFRFDVRFALRGVCFLVEVASSDDADYKPVQTQAQVIGFANAMCRSDGDRDVLYVKILARPREIRVWRLVATQNALRKGDYSPQRLMTY